MAGSKKHSSAKSKTNPSSSRSGKDKVSVAQDSGEGLVGARIKVWWPLDRQFYEGVVDSYASSKKKHRVLYDDGDVENLDLKKERWELIEEKDAVANEDESGDESSEATPELKSKAKSGKILDDSEEEIEKQKSGVKKLEKTKDLVKESPKPETERNGTMGDIGGKIVAAASRMSGRRRINHNGKEKEKGKALYGEAKKRRSSRKKRKMNHSALSSAEALSKEAEDAENDTAVNDMSEGEDSKLLVSFLNKFPEQVQALMEKKKEKEEKAGGEENSDKEAEVEEK